jgi:hypothetical protein
MIFPAQCNEMWTLLLQFCSRVQPRLIDERTAPVDQLRNRHEKSGLGRSGGAAADRRCHLFDESLKRAQPLLDLALALLAELRDVDGARDRARDVRQRLTPAAQRGQPLRQPEPPAPRRGLLLTTAVAIFRPPLHSLAQSLAMPLLAIRGDCTHIQQGRVDRGKPRA